MSILRAKATLIKKLKMGAKIVEDKDNFQVVTVIQFETETDPKEFVPILQALAGQAPIDVEFTCKQLALDGNDNG